MFDDTEPVKDSNVSASDTLAVFELESSPTDYSIANPDEVYEPNETPGFDSPKAERMLIPVYQRGWVAKSFNKSKERKIFGPPTFIVVKQEEAFDFDSILKKLL
ncbi:ubiquitin carboxyl-terminal hydrolase, partial [Aspergillus sclerotialis]